MGPIKKNHSYMVFIEYDSVAGHILTIVNRNLMKLWYKASFPTHEKACIKALQLGAELEEKGAYVVEEGVTY